MTLYHSGRWEQLRCSQCCVKSRRWRCLCGAQWTGCSIHAHSGFLCHAPRFGLRSVSSRQQGVAGMQRATTTNHIPPPTQQAQSAKRPRKPRRQSTGPSAGASDGPGKTRKHSLVGISGSEDTNVSKASRTMRHGPDDDPQRRPGGSCRKRAASKQLPKPRAKAKARCDSSDALGAIARLREARVNHL